MSEFCWLVHRKINYFCAWVNKLWNFLHTFIIVLVRETSRRSLFCCLVFDWEDSAKLMILESCVLMNSCSVLRQPLMEWGQTWKWIFREIVEVLPWSLRVSVSVLNTVYYGKNALFPYVILLYTFRLILTCLCHFFSHFVFG